MSSEKKIIEAALSCDEEALRKDLEAFGRQKKINGAKSFAKLVKKMRENQKLYFDTRDNQVLKESKALEEKVDRAVKMVLK